MKERVVIQLFLSVESIMKGILRLCAVISVALLRRVVVLALSLAMRENLLGKTSSGDDAVNVF